MGEPTLNPAVQGVLLEAAPRLVDGLLHDARNPLNALAINLEVLSDKLRQSTALGNTEKNLRAMREQILRVDNILRRFGDFLAPRRLGAGQANLSELLESALEVAAHEARKKGLRLVARVEPGLRVWLQHAWSAHFLVLQPILRAIARAEAGSDIEVSLSRQAGHPILAVTESRSGNEDGPNFLPALEHVCREIGGSSTVRGGEFHLAFPSVGTD